MVVFGLVFTIITISIVGLAIGVIFGRTPVKGTCAGTACPKAFECHGCHQYETKEEKL